MAKSTYYEILGVANTATDVEIKKAYRKLIRKYHPDVSDDPHADEKTSQINAAYQVLKDPEKRTAYDTELANPFAGHQQQQSRQQGNYSSDHQEFNFDDFADIFGQASGRGRHSGGFRFDDGFSAYQDRTSSMAGQDQHAELTIDIIDAYHGSEKSLSVAVPTIDERGGIITVQKTLKVKIPKGIREGQQIRLAGQGMLGFGGAKAGDLYIKIKFAESETLYVKSAKDVYQTVSVMPWQAALGEKVTVPTVAGNLAVSLPEGTWNGKTLRVKGKGLPNKEVAGDLYLIIRIQMPPVETADKSAWQALKAHYENR